MKKTGAGHIYASALFQLAAEHQLVESIEKEARLVKEIFKSEPKLWSFLNSPKISLERKKEIITEAFSFLSEYVLNTILLLIDRSRIDQVLPVMEQYIRLSYERKGIAPATVESVRPLTDEEKAAISHVFAKMVNKNALEIHNVVNSDILGGLKIQIENRIYDGSLRGKLDRLKRKLVTKETV